METENSKNDKNINFHRDICVTSRLIYIMEVMLFKYQGWKEGGMGRIRLDWTLFYFVLVKTLGNIVMAIIH